MKSKSILLIYLLLNGFTLTAQQDFKVFSGNQEIVQNCIDSVVYLIRQDYVLQ